MNAFTAHALADARHAERYAGATCATGVSAARRRRSHTALTGARRRLGVLLVEAGLQLLVRAEPAPVSSALTR